jgi:hypothetical protein
MAVLLLITAAVITVATLVARRLRPAVAVDRGLLAGLLAPVGFATTVILLLARLPLGAAFGLAVLLTLSIRLGSLQIARRGPVAA